MTNNGKCSNCPHRDSEGMCVKIKEIMGYELIVHDECIFGNFTFTEKE